MRRRMIERRCIGAEHAVHGTTHRLHGVRRCPPPVRRIAFRNLARL